MKRMLTALIVLIAVAVLSACGQQPDETAEFERQIDSDNLPTLPTTTLRPTATPAISGSGGGKLALDAAIDEVVVLYENLLDVLASVTDEASARAAIEDVTRISSQFQALDDRMGEYSQAEIASAVLSGRLMGLGEELSREIIRISTDPTIFMLLSEAFENLN